MKTIDETRSANGSTDPFATIVRPTDDSPRTAGGVAVPGFEIDGTLGRGGMGVVYKARQTGLNRVVALKMLLAGQYADPSLRARFLLEAESVAALEHPGIVRVFQFGESGGHPYLAMEYLPGGTLADRIKANGPLSADDAAELVAKLAAAVAHAHSRGVVHRDIKPLNVLLGADGEPRLADFGLAKVGRADQNLSVTGQVLGTPAYMAPEQAAGKVHEVGTAADVYALGAVLYDALTGRPPFRGDSAVATLQKVLTEEPQRLRKLNATIPRDLEAICLTCLEKESGRRYPTAQALADDLLRSLRNEPISVRPAGVLERGRKWVKRNKVVAGAVAAVALALLVGAGASFAFGLEAKRQAEDAKQKQNEAHAATAREEMEKRDALAARNDALAARNDLKGRNDELIRSRERVNHTLARALLGPIIADHRANKLTPYEQEALWQVAELRREETAFLFIQEATRTPLSCRQFAARSGYAMHAAVGLDPARRSATERLVLARLREPGTQVTTAQSLAKGISGADGFSSETLAIAARVLANAIIGEKNAYIQRPLAMDLAAVAARLAPPEAAWVCAGPARALLETFTKESNSVATKPFAYPFAESLAAVAACIEPAEAVDLCTPAAHTLAAALAKETDSYTRREMAKMLAVLAARLEPITATKLCTPAAHAAANAIVDQREQSSPIFEPSAVLFALTTWMEPAEALALRNRTARTLADRLAKETNQYSAYGIAIDLVGLAARTGSAEATDARMRAARTLANKLANEPNPFARRYMAASVCELTAGIDSAEAADARAQAARAFGDAIVNTDTTTDLIARRAIATGLANAAGHKKPEDGSRALADLIALEIHSGYSSILAVCLTVVATRLEPSAEVEVRARAAHTILAWATSPPDRREKASGLAALSLGLLPDALARSRGAAALATGAFAAPHNVLASLPLLHPHFQPQPRPLPPQTLVELLKHPFCVGEARRAVLDALESTYRRKFKDQWEFVEYAQKHQPQLDLLTPPKRPEAKP